MGDLVYFYFSIDDFCYSFDSSCSEFFRFVDDSGNMRIADNLLAGLMGLDIFNGDGLSLQIRSNSDSCLLFANLIEVCDFKDIAKVTLSEGNLADIVLLEQRIVD